MVKQEHKKAEISSESIQLPAHPYILWFTKIKVRVILMLAKIHHLAILLDDLKFMNKVYSSQKC